MVTLDPRHVQMAKSVAMGMMRRLPRNVLLADLMQSALVGLLDALQRHPEGEGPSYDWYLRCRIRGEIIDELRRQDWCQRRRPGVTVASVVLLDDLRGDLDEWEERIAGVVEDPEAVAITRCDAQKAWRTKQKPRDVRIMRACFEQGRLHKAVGVDENISEARVTQLVGASLIRMRSELTGESRAEARLALRAAGGR